MESGGDTHSQETPGRRRAGRFLRLLGIVLLVLILLFLLTVLALRQPRVQNALADYYSDRLSEKLDVRVAVGEVNIDWRRGVVLQDAIIEDRHQDTMIYVRKISTDLSESLASLLYQRIRVDEIRLEGMRVKLSRSTEVDRINWAEVFTNSEEDSTATTSSSWDVSLSKFYLSDFHFVLNDEVAGRYLSAKIPEGALVMNRINFPGDIDIRNFYLSEPDINYEYWQTAYGVVSPEQDSAQRVPIAQSDAGSQDWYVGLQDFNIIDGTLRIWNRDTRDETLRGQPGQMDYGHVVVHELQASLTKLLYEDGQLSVQRPELKAQSSSGFRIDELIADSLVIHDKKAGLVGMRLRTNHSSVNNDIRLRYRSYEDFKNFADRVYIDFDLENSTIDIRDVQHFSTDLASSRFVQSNQDLALEINGQLKGRLNNLTLRDVDIRVEDDLSLNGNIRLRDILNSDDALINFQLENLESSVSSLEQRIPGFTMPAGFDKLGEFSFNGQFDGFLSDFVAYGRLDSELGAAKLDMRLDTRHGRDRARYSGDVELLGFDLGKWTGDTNLGLVQGTAEVSNGIGLTAQLAEADLDAKIISLDYKGYNYRDIILKATVSEGILDGALEIDDRNMDLTFEGIIDITEEKPVLDFRAAIDTIDLSALYLSDREIQLSGTIDMSASDMNPGTLDGEILLGEWTMRIDDSLVYVFDTVEISSGPISNGQSLTVRSDVLDLAVDGQFKLDELHHSLLGMIHEYYPRYVDRLELPAARPDIDPQQYNLDLHIKNSQDLPHLISPAFDTLSDFQILADVDDIAGSAHIDITLPVLRIDDISSYDLHLGIDMDRAESHLNVSMDSLFISTSNRFRNVSFSGIAVPDTLYYEIRTGRLSDEVQGITLGGDIFEKGPYLANVISASGLQLYDDIWQVNPENILLYGPGYIHAENFYLTNGDQRIFMNTINDRGVELDVRDFNLKRINDLWYEEKLDFAGPVRIYVRSEDVFELKNFEAEWVTDSLLINEDNFGHMRAVARMDGVKNPIDVDLRMEASDRSMAVNGKITPKGFTGNASDALLLDLVLDVDDYPLSIAEYFIGDGIEGTQGTADIDLTVSGPTNLLDIDGEVEVTDLETRVIYLGTTYRVESHRLPITNTMIDATGAELIDKFGNRAQATGGVSHDRFTNFLLNVDLSSDRFTGLDTDRSNEEVYYGTAIGAMDISFRGPFNAPDIKIDAQPGEGSVLYIPLDTETSVSELDFVSWTHDTLSTEIDEDRFKIKGVNVEMNVDVDPRSEVQIIFDESAGDIMRGRGEGDLNLVLNRNGDFNLYGDYTLTEGDYLFTYQELFLVNKVFTVRPGGTLSWTGDPFNADLNLSAYYTTSTSVYNLIEEFIQAGNTNISGDAQRSQRINVLLYLTGPLSQPKIDFDLEFINIPSSLRNFISTKINSLRADPNEMNRQVFGLLVTGGFLPSTGLGSNVASIETGINTLSEFISNQLSNYVSELLGDAIEDIGFISNFDLQFNYRQSADNNIAGATSTFELAPRIELLDGKAVLTSTNSFINSQGINGAYVANDLLLEFFLTDNRRLVLKAYQISDLELGNRKIEVGLGVSYRRDFDHFFKKSNKVDPEIKSTDNNSD